MKGVEHEFSAIEGVYEDVIEIISNLKKIRFKSFSQEPVKATLEVHGDKEITAKDIKLPTDVELINPDQYILTLTDKKSSISMEIEIEKGVGYVPVEQRQKEKLAIGMIAIDAIFSPVKLVNFKVEDTRVGQRIDFNKITMEVETDGSMEPELALKKASDILSEHFQVISEINVPEPESDSPKPAKKVSKDKKKDAK